MAVSFLVLLAALLFEDDYLLPAAVLDDGGRDRAAAEFDAVAVALQKRVEFDRCADFSLDRGNANHLAFADAELFAPGLNDSVCHC